MTELRSTDELAPPLLRTRTDEIRHQNARLTNYSHSVRIAAALQLGELGAEAIPSLRKTLRDSNSDVRVAVVQSLQRISTAGAVKPISDTLNDGPDNVTFAVDALCEALKHRDRATRTAAANALGDIRDARAVPHLLEAHRQCFVARSVRGQLLLGIVVLLVIVALFAVFIWGGITAKAFGVIGSFQFILRGGFAYFEKRKAQSEVAAAISQALLKIAECSASPEIHRIVPELRMLTHDPLQHSRETRSAATDIADRIEELTGRLQQLPVTSPAPASPGQDSLPRIRTEEPSPVEGCGTAK